MRKQVLFIADSLNNAYKFQHVLIGLDVDITTGTTAQAKRLLAPGANPNLIIFEAIASARSHLREIGTLAENLICPLLVIIDEEGATDLSLPALVPSDFAMSSANEIECATRVNRLLGIMEQEPREQVIEIGSMVLNLATYQVTVAGEPVDLTYLEYALLAYLVQHPSHTFTRDALLQNVWGLDYYGGSRTVDVHVRRVRAKLGPNLAQHLETVRGVGYLWNPQP